MSTGEEYLDAIEIQLRRGRNQWKRGDKLLEAFGYARRRQRAIDLIRSALDDRGMTTAPVLSTSMPLDRAIRFLLRDVDGEAAADIADSAISDDDTPTERVAVASADTAFIAEEVSIPLEPPAGDFDDPTERALIVGNLACAERAPVAIDPSQTVKQAFTLMALHDFSQLVVMTGRRSVKGLISHRSIARAFSLGNPNPNVMDCTDRVDIVEVDEPLLKVVARFWDQDAVVVADRDRTPVGIVTPADIAKEFEGLAAPFLLIGQIEEQLRWLVQRKVDISEALDRAHVDGAAPVRPDDLTMGELQRILENDANWCDIGITFDRSVFCSELNAVRETRNAVMHFRDVSDEAIAQMKRFAAAVQRAYFTICRDRT